MTEDRLGESLRHADRDWQREGAPLDPASIRTRAGRRRRNRRSVQAGLLLLLVAAGILLAARGPARKPPRVLSTRPSDSSNTAVAAGDELSIAERIALEAQIRMDHRLLVAQARSVEGIDLADQRDQAAQTMVLVAQRRREIVGKQEAAELYERTIALFPETPSAGAAREALAQLKQDN